ncbi:helix-turn-helix domain-containing protein [Streptomyces zagrosensis]|uniref:Transcriptional regulator with XRE-family HTH domain n=1 Tax=Streptomyces zagrosensis TaxID=1042984 RepID=A0A7W9UXG5_9ACTN|nr:helix-turn-helix transcriptional regulator [Streptomyces zagrosensis]MBB5934607.1 transcriptional regulator with XRE-family HTH domain [Streptomyces zagrosensis]
MTADMTFGERVRDLRERRNLTRTALGGLVGRGPDWVKKIERGERDLRSLVLLLRLARALGCQDLAQLTGGASVPVLDGGKVTHPGVLALRRAIVEAPLGAFSADTDAALGDISPAEYAGRVQLGWEIWHRARRQRTEISKILPSLITTGHALERTVRDDSPQRRQVAATLTATYALAQQYAAYTTEPELYWIIVDRARMWAEQADDPLTLAGAAWVVGHGLRAQGHTDEALRMARSAASGLRDLLETGDDQTRAMYGALCLHAAVTAAEDAREGEAWHEHDEAARVAKTLPRGYAHPWTVFGSGNVAVHAVTLGAQLRTPGTALRRLEDVTDPMSIPSTERRSRLYLDAAKAERARRELPSALQYLRLAHETSPEAVRFVPSGRALATDLARTITGPLAGVARSLADTVSQPSE